MLMRGRYVLAAAAAVLALGGAAVALSSRAAEPPPVLWRPPPFTLTDHAGDRFTSDALEGTAWIGSFIYTHCPDICPTITSRLAALRDSLAAEGLLGRHVRLVSFTVDPARDTPAVLGAYAERFGGADPASWAFLTGDSAAVRRVITDGFYMPALRVDSPATADGRGSLVAEEARDRSASGHAGHDAGADGHRAGPGGHGASPNGHRAGPGGHGAPAGASSYLVAHTDRLVLVDGEGRVRGIYSSLDPVALDSLRADLGALLR